MELLTLRLSDSWHCWDREFPEKIQQATPCINDPGSWQLFVWQYRELTLLILLVAESRLSLTNISTNSTPKLKNLAGLLFCHKYISWTVYCAGLLYYPLYRWCIRSKTPYSISNRIVYRNRETVKNFFCYRYFLTDEDNLLAKRVSKWSFFTNPSKLEHLYQIQFCLCSGLVWLAVGFNLLNLFVTGRNLKKISWADSFKKWKWSTACKFSQIACGTQLSLGNLLIGLK